MDVRAYMVPKNELLEWCSQVLDLEVTRLEHCTSGAIYCQLLDAYYGNNAINLSKVNFLAKIDYEIVSNYKQLQLGLNKAGIEKYIDVERLAKGSQSDNLEFLQWLYHECRRKGRNPNYYYNARERRALCKGGDTKEIPLPFSMASNFIPVSEFNSPMKKIQNSGLLEPNGEIKEYDSRHKYIAHKYVPLPARKADPSPRDFAEPRVTSGRRNSAESSPRSDRRHKGSDRPTSSKAAGAGVTAASELESPKSARNSTGSFEGSAALQSPGTSATPLAGPDGSAIDPESAQCADDAAQQAVSVLLRSLPGLKRLLGQVGSESADGFNHRGKLRSRRDVMQTLVQQTWVLLRDLHLNAMNNGGMDGRNRARRLESLQKELQGAQSLFEELCDEVDKAEKFYPVPQGGLASLNSARPAAPGEKHQADANHLDQALRAVGAAQTSLAPVHKASLIAAEAQCHHADAILAQAREALQNDFKDSRPPFRVALKPNTMGYVGSINIGAYKDTEDWLAQLRNFPEDPNKPRFQVPLRGEGGDNIVSALHDKGVASQERQFPFPSSVLAKYGIFDGGIQDDEHVSHSTGATMAGLRVMSPETVQMVCDTAEDSAHSATQYASASLHKRRGEPDAKSAGAGVAVGTATYGSSVPADDEASRCKTQYDAEAEALGQFDSAVNRARILTSSSVAAGTEPAGTPKSKRLFASASVGVDTDQWANPEADAVAAALAVAQVQSKETDELEEEAALTAAATKCAAMKALGLVAEFDYTDHLAADGASRAGLRASRADFGATTNYANQLPEAPVPMEGVEPIRAQTQAPHMKNPDNKKTGLVGAFSARTRGSVAEAEYIVDLPNKGEGELTSRVIKPRDMREVTYEVRTLANGDNYKGPYLRGFKAGEGVYTFSNGDVYAGEFLDDAMEGYGVYVFANNGRYEGQWNEALYQGVGMETFARGSTYHGEYSKGMRSGFGICRYYNGDYYEGQWQAGLRHGRGMQQCTDESNYVGDYNSGKRHGHGVYSFPNGDRYMGAYRGDVPHGYGVYLFASGQKYEGQWHHGKKHGRCVYTIETGEQWAGEWRESKPKWVQSLTDTEATRGQHANAVQLSLKAAEEARIAAKDGASRADEHWRTNGPMQLGVRDVVLRADRAAAEAQAARQRALVVASSIDDGRKLAEQAGGVGARGRLPNAASSKPNSAGKSAFKRMLTSRF